MSIIHVIVPYYSVYIQICPHYIAPLMKNMKIIKDTFAKKNQLKRITIDLWKVFV